MVAASAPSPATKPTPSGANRSGGGWKRPKTPSANDAKASLQVKMAPPKRRDGSGSSPTSEIPLPAITNGHKTLSGNKDQVRKLAKKNYKDPEVTKMIEDEKPQLENILREVRDRAEDVRDKVAALARRATEEASEDPGPREQGASLLAAKQTLLLSYCRELCAYVAAKGNGEALKGGGPLGRLVELRTVMEKMRPLERKLKYQTDKLLRLALTPTSKDMEASGDGEGDGDEDPLSFRPRPEAMAVWGDGNADESGPAIKGDYDGRKMKANKGGGTGDTGGLYRAPRLASVPYDEDGGGGAKEKRRLEKRRDKLRRGEVMETLREEFGDQPETVRPVGNTGASGVAGVKMKRMLEEEKERRDFEENHMVRLTVTRKAKKAKRQIEKDAGRLETIADVGSAADFVRVANDADGFGDNTAGGLDYVGGGGARGRKRKGGNGALKRAMGAVGGSMPIAGLSQEGTKSKGKGKKKYRR